MKWPPLFAVQVLVCSGFVFTEGKIDYSVAEGLLQIQRVLELSTEIANAEDVSTLDSSNGESRYAGIYVLPDSLQIPINYYDHASHFNSDERGLSSMNELTHQSQLKSEPLAYASLKDEPTHGATAEMSYEIPVPLSYVSAYISGSSKKPQQKGQVITDGHKFLKLNTHDVNGQLPATKVPEGVANQRSDVAAAMLQPILFDNGQTYTQALIRPNQPVLPVFTDNYANVINLPDRGHLRTQIHGAITDHNSLDPFHQHIPLQILINQLAERPDSRTGLTPIGREQPKIPVYHYSPVPFGVIKNEHIPEMRIKSGVTMPNPHSHVEEQPFSPAPSTDSPFDDYEDDERDKYDFGYRVTDEEHNVEFGKVETKRDGVTKGSYHVLLPDGRLQVVDYWSDHTGYHTNISYSVPHVYS